MPVLAAVWRTACLLLLPWSGANSLSAEDRPNILLILCDDHRWDALSFAGHPFLRTPHLDRLASGGAHFRQALVTTSLCSPSRASILTGMYAHRHRVIDNYHPVDPSLRFFPEYLQQAGYETAFVGKWHMGDVDEPQRGFDHWVAFRGQGTYYPDGHGTSRVVPQTRYDGWNVNGHRVPQRGYITDELTDYALQWLAARANAERPFFLYVSHKAVHSDFVPRDSDRGAYERAAWRPPASLSDTPDNRRGKPRWVLDQRNSRHGVDFGYNLEDFNLEFYYKRYCETLIAVDDSVGQLTRYLHDSQLIDKTLVVYLGDNGFQFGEHGLIDKRTAYEASIRIPLLMHCPGKIAPGSTVDAVVANIDIGPTILEAAGVAVPAQMQGLSAWKLAQGQTVPWRDALLYEYFWEWNYPQTPTVLAIRGDRYKYIRSHGVWDTDELYDLREDPSEQHNLVADPAHARIAAHWKQRLFRLLAETGGRQLPLLPDRGRQFYHRDPDGAPPGAFPERFYAPPLSVTE
jgi:N-acetylglucosamine-6-sulfatase